MAGEGILIIIIPNDVTTDQQKPLDVVQIVTDSADLPVKLATPTPEVEHSKEFPCAACGPSLTSRFRCHLRSKLNLLDAIWILSEDQQHFFITCFAELGQHSDFILEELRLAEIGIREGSKVFILPLSCALGIHGLAASGPAAIDISDPGKEVADADESRPLTSNGHELSERLGASQSNFKRSIRARLTVLQVVNAIRGQTLFSFDFLLLTILASFIALLGLLEDNSVILVASMLVSPLMGPIFGIVFGLCIGDSRLWKVGLKTEAIGLFVAILTGFVAGLCTTWSETRWGASSSFPTHEMRSRGDIRRLWAGALVALPSGAGAALSVLGGNVGSLVGVAISASLLPPAVNAGLLLSYSLLSAMITKIGKQSTVFEQHDKSDAFTDLARNCTKFVGNDYLPIYSCNMATETGLLGICSFVLTMTNILCIVERFLLCQLDMTWRWVHGVKRSAVLWLDGETSRFNLLYRVAIDSRRKLAYEQFSFRVSPLVLAMVILRIKEVVPIIRDDEIAQFWHDDVRIVRGQNKSIHQRDITNLVDIWKTMSNTNSTSLPSEDNQDAAKSNDKTTERRKPWRQRDKAQMVIARKLKNLQDLANAYDLNLSNVDDTSLKTEKARRNVERMASDVLASIDESHQINFGSFVATFGEYGGRSMTQARMQTFYQELLDVMPSKWKEIFQKQQSAQK